MSEAGVFRGMGEASREPARNSRTSTTARPVLPLPDADISPFAALLAPPRTHRHSVQFYEDDAYLTQAVVEFLTDGMLAGQGAIVIATPEHREAFVKGLGASGVDVTAARDAGLIVLLDARETILGCMIDGALNDAAFRAAIGGVIEQSLSAGSGSSLRMYGEMVDVLWKDGATDAAILMEDMWNAIGNRYEFSLLCAYAMGNFYKSEDAECFRKICSQHTHVIPTERFTFASDEERLVEISQLQQRARALEAEISHREDLEQRLRHALSAHHRTEDILRQRERELTIALSDRETLLERERIARADAEQARVHADEANCAKSEFLAAMSHELRTPLNAIGGYVQLVQLGIHGPITEEQQTALRRVQRSQQHLLSLINDMLNFAKLEAGRVEYRLEEVPLVDAIGDVACMVEPQLAAKGITYTVRTTSDVVRADREKLQQILLNLISNAVKFTDTGGEVTVETARREGGPPDVVFLRVSDTGCGIQREKHDLIFDPFVQVATRLIRAQEGTGLGLAISRELARGMGGDIRVRSVEGKGSVFTVELPAVDAQETAVTR